MSFWIADPGAERLADTTDKQYLKGVIREEAKFYERSKIYSLKQGNEKAKRIESRKGAAHSEPLTKITTERLGKGKRADEKK
jgi:hypothetical protein